MWLEGTHGDKGICPAPFMQLLPRQICPVPSLLSLQYFFQKMSFIFANHPVLLGLRWVSHQPAGGKKEKKERLCLPVLFIYLLLSVSCQESILLKRITFFLTKTKILFANACHAPCMLVWFLLGSLVILWEVHNIWNMEEPITVTELVSSLAFKWETSDVCPLPVYPSLESNSQHLLYVWALQSQGVLLYTMHNRFTQFATMRCGDGHGSVLRKGRLGLPTALKHESRLIKPPCLGQHIFK